MASAKAQQTRVVAGRDRIGATDTQVELARVGDVEAAKFSKTDISIKSTGKGIRIKGGCYSFTNHYIRKSRGYVKKDGKLRQFINYPFMGYTCFAYTHLLLYLCRGAEPPHTVVVLCVCPSVCLSARFSTRRHRISC